VAAGPLGREASAQTDITMRAEMLAWSRARGVFAGVALQGSTLREDSGENKELYGKEVTNRDIVTGKVAPPAAADEFLKALSKY
jgi:lipid-binding SYLF domain-containing protein